MSDDKRLFPCDFCTGSYWLSDTPTLGPCVCCTPDNMQALEAMWVDTERELREAHEGQEAAIKSGVASFQEASNHYAGIIATARDHLQRYFQRVYGQSRPAGSTFDEDLDAIAEAILYEPLEVT